MGTSSPLIIEFGERRRLHARHAYPSLFEYCTKVLGYSEDAAYKRTRVARAAIDRPEILAIWGWRDRIG